MSDSKSQMAVIYSFFGNDPVRVRCLETAFRKWLEQDFQPVRILHRIITVQRGHLAKYSLPNHRQRVLDLRVASASVQNAIHDLRIGCGMHRRVQGHLVLHKPER